MSPERDHQLLLQRTTYLKQPFHYAKKRWPALGMKVHGVKHFSESYIVLGEIERNPVIWLQEWLSIIEGYRL